MSDSVATRLWHPVTGLAGLLAACVGVGALALGPVAPALLYLVLGLTAGYAASGST